MNIDATFWVGISFVLFVGVLFYFKVPQKISNLLDENINRIKKNINEAEKLKDDAKNILSECETKLSKSKQEVDALIKNAKNYTGKSTKTKIKPKNLTNATCAIYTCFQHFFTVRVIWAFLRSIHKLIIHQQKSIKNEIELKTNAK